MAPFFTTSLIYIIILIYIYVILRLRFLEFS